MKIIQHYGYNLRQKPALLPIIGHGKKMKSGNQYALGRGDDGKFYLVYKDGSVVDYEKISRDNPKIINEMYNRWIKDRDYLPFDKNPFDKE